MEIIILLLILIVVLSIILLIFSLQTKEGSKKTKEAITGGEELFRNISDTEFGIEKLIVSDCAKFIIDGNNMVYALNEKNSKVDNDKFESNLRKISKILQNSLPNKELHIIVKNPNRNEDLESKQKSKQESKQESKKGSKKAEDQIPYFRNLINLSKDYSGITYHLAYDNGDKETRKKLHHLNGRDDFLSLYLAKDGYVLSNDKYRDFDKFMEIPSFSHFATKNGNIIIKERINPKQFFEKHFKPTVGNHISYEFIDKDRKSTPKHINSGDIIVTKGNRGHMYLIF